MKCLCPCSTDQAKANSKSKSNEVLKNDQSFKINTEKIISELKSPKKQSFQSTDMKSKKFSDSLNIINGVNSFKTKVKNYFSCTSCGNNCPKENYKNHSLFKSTKKIPVIPGLNSDLLNNCIIASQRPSTFLIEKFDICSSFEKYNFYLNFLV